MIEVATKAWLRLIFASIELIAPKPLPIGLPENPKTLGERIRKARMERGQFQKDVAGILHVTTSSVENWERNMTKPLLDWLPRIIDFLGYVPDPYKNNTRLKKPVFQYRAKHRPGVKAMADLLRVYKCTLFSWETGRNPMSEENSFKFKWLHQDCPE